MLKETSICSTVVAIGVVLLGVGFGWELTALGSIALVVAAGPFIIATLLQIRVLRAIAEAKADAWRHGVPNASEAAANMVIEQPRTGGGARPEVSAAPEPERVRLLPVRTSANAVVLASGFVSHDGQMVRTVPVAVPRLIDGCEEHDLIAFIDGLSFRGHAKRGWMRVRLPSGRICDEPYYNLLVAPLVKIGAVVDRGPRKAGKLVMEPDEMKIRLGFAPAGTSLTMEPIPMTMSAQPAA